MSRFETDRANREAAWTLFNTRLAQVKADLAARGIGGRIAAKTKQDAIAVAGDAVAIVRDNKGIVAAALVAVLGWAFRAPLLGLVAGLAAKRRGTDANGMAATTEEDGQ